MLNPNFKIVNLFKMKKIIFVNIILAVMFKAKLFAQNLLPDKWKYRVGDDPEWTIFAFNDTLWADLLSDESQEEQGFPNYGEYAWYGTKEMIPSTYKTDAEK